MLEVDASELLVDGSNDVWFCKTESDIKDSDPWAGEFIFEVGNSPDEAQLDLTPVWIGTLKSMQNFGCSEEFIAAYQQAVDLGVSRILYYTT
jgi:hypothetical protein